MSGTARRVDLVTSSCACTVRAVEGQPDVLAQGRDREPWRPSRRAVGGVLLSAVLLGATGYGLDAWQQSRAERAAHLQAVHNITLSIQQDRNPGDGATGLTLLNESGIEVRLRSAALDFPDVTVLTPTPLLVPYEPLPLGSPAAAACVTGLYQRGPRFLLVHGSTADGLDVTRRLQLTEGDQDVLWHTLRQTCHFYPPDEALDSVLRNARLEGRRLLLTYDLRNKGAAPLVLDGFLYEPGIEVVAEALPLTVPPDKPGTEVPGRSTVVELRVTSCERLAAAVRRARGGNGLDGPGSLKVSLHHQHAQAQANLDLRVSNGGAEGTVDWGLRLLRTCQNVAELLDTPATVQ